MDSSNIGLNPEERGYLALLLKIGGKSEAEKILQLIKQEETNPFTYLKVRTLKSKGVLKFCDFTICDPCYFVILFRPQFCEFMILKKRSKHNMFWIFFFFDFFHIFFVYKKKLIFLSVFFFIPFVRFYSGSLSFLTQSSLSTRGLNQRDYSMA